MCYLSRLFVFVWCFACALSYDLLVRILLFFFFKQKTAYEMRISDWSSDVCSSDLVAAQVDAFVLLEAVGEIFDELAVEILTAEEGVAVGRVHLEYAVANLEHRDVECAAAKVIDREDRKRVV